MRRDRRHQPRQRPNRIHLREEQLPQRDLRLHRIGKADKGGLIPIGGAPRHVARFA